MGNIATFLIGMVGPLMAKFLVVIGFQIVTITGATAALGGIKTLFLSHLGSVQAAGLQLAMLAGTGEALGMIFGAITARLALWQITQSVRILGVAA